MDEAGKPSAGRFSGREDTADPAGEATLRRNRTLVNEQKGWLESLAKPSIAHMSVDPAQLRIVTWPHPVLLQGSEPVDPADENVRAVARRMLELMREADGVGLAAPQVALPWRLFVTHAPEIDPVDRVFINPELKLGRGELITEEEGCLSLPGINVQVRRPDEAEITAVNLEGQSVTRSASGMLARIWQHESDHLNGVVLVHKMNPMDRLATRKTLKELKAAVSE